MWNQICHLFLLKYQPISPSESEKVVPKTWFIVFSGSSGGKSSSVGNASFVVKGLLNKSVIWKSRTSIPCLCSRYLITLIRSPGRALVITGCCSTKTSCLRSNCQVEMSGLSGLQFFQVKGGGGCQLEKSSLAPSLCLHKIFNVGRYELRFLHVISHISTSWFSINCSSEVFIPFFRRFAFVLVFLQHLIEE